jgi:hypothetical protein
LDGFSAEAALGGPAGASHVGRRLRRVQHDSKPCRTGHIFTNLPNMVVVAEPGPRTSAAAIGHTGVRYPVGGVAGRG